MPEILRNKKQFAKLTTDWQNARHKYVGVTHIVKALVKHWGTIVDPSP